jgi:hypothetical protein
MQRIKDLWPQFGARAARAIRPNNSKKNVRRLGILIIGLCTLLGVSQAGSLQKLLVGSADSTAGMQTQLTAQNAVPTQVAAGSTAAASASEPDLISSTPNIVDLVGGSELILRGTVKEVIDGFENGVPYTQVTLQVTEGLRGQVGEEYTFRQFGLKQPRKMDNGKVYLGVSPDGWARYAVGEDAMLFLYKRASLTGLQTTVGLGQGKVVFQGGNAISQSGKIGLFENVDVDARLLNDKDKRLLGTKKGAVNADGFLSFVRRAVKDKWIEGRKMRHAKN